ncbi:hypothetical protein BKA93DRAFT_820935 [Sparassis latifolia]|uniref:Uncharacterized protein n=1 Tax=Sparassis crispa TaxID=139825 RepID=A0A401GGL6_9APHY|nr:hypothetical protein SCP_0310020 [Sparassis crispa]GBE81275.1 hypothetical protein SCP_0310020 [Sparassis crispa]
MSPSSPSSGSSSSPIDTNSPPPQPLRIWWTAFPSIKIIRPPKGRFSPQVDERCFTYCSQSIRGRLDKSEPWCRTICVRRVFSHEVQRIISVHEGQEQIAQMKYPLPPEGQRTPSLTGMLSGQPNEENEPRQTEVRHWNEGWYLWSSKSRWAAQERMDLMMCDIERQAEWQRYKEEMNEKWTHHGGEQAIHQSAGHEELESLPDVPPELNNVEHIPQKPFPDLADQSILIPIPFPSSVPPFQHQIENLLTPTHKVLGLLYQTVDSGEQWGFAKRIWEKAWTPEPFVLARNVCTKMWEKWKDGPPDDSSDTKV